MARNEECFINQSQVKKFGHMFFLSVVVLPAISGHILPLFSPSFVVFMLSHFGRRRNKKEKDDDGLLFVANNVQ